MLGPGAGPPVLVTDTADPKVTRQFENFAAIVAETRVVRIAGTCNRMPSVGTNFMPIESAFVLEGQRRDQVEYVGFGYDGIDEDVHCDDYVY